MTDHPRFQPFRGQPDEVYRHYHGAPIVALVLALAERWQRRSPPAYGTFASWKPQPTVATTAAAAMLLRDTAEAPPHKRS